MKKEKIKVTEDESNLIYSWKTLDHDREIHQEIKLKKPTTVSHCSTAFKGVSTFRSSQFIDNDYFLQYVAVEEIRSWAKIIDRTIGLKLLSISVNSSARILWLNRQAFVVKIIPYLLLFSNEVFIDIWKVNVYSKKKRKILDQSNFPRYYVCQENALAEAKQLIFINDIKSFENLQLITNN